jgi:hypothetical protein
MSKAKTLVYNPKVFKQQDKYGIELTAFAPEEKKDWAQ